MADIFVELIFGNSAWLGFVILFLFSIILIKLYKYSAIVMSIFFILLGVEYLNLYSSGNTNLTWFWAFSWIVAIMLILFMLRSKK